MKTIIRELFDRGTISISLQPGENAYGGQLGKVMPRKEKRMLIPISIVL